MTTSVRSIFLGCCYLILLKVSDPAETPISNPVEETQSAVCKIFTEEVVAVANASITRQLHGVCSSHEMEERFDRLEKIILEEINAIKYLLEGSKVPLHKTPNNNDLDDINNGKNLLWGKTGNRFYFNTINSEEPNKTVNKKKTRQAEDISRELEILKFNSTIQNTNFGLTFTYYWIIYDIDDILPKPDISIRSPYFFTSGFHLQIIFMPHHLGTKYAGIELDANKYFTKAHRFSVLNKVNPKADLTSQLLGDPRNFATIYKISHDKFENKEFTSNNSLIIKLSAYLQAR